MPLKPTKISILSSINAGNKNQLSIDAGHHLKIGSCFLIIISVDVFSFKNMIFFHFKCYFCLKNNFITCFMLLHFAFINCYFKHLILWLQIPYQVKIVWNQIFDRWQKLCLTKQQKFRLTNVLHSQKFWYSKFQKHFLTLQLQEISLPVITCSKLTIETLEQGVKYV